MTIELRPLEPDDWPAVRAIYLEGIATGIATFQTEAPDWEAWDAGRLRACRIVATDAGRVVGWAALSPVSSRPCYAGVAEVTLYVGEAARGHGVGRCLMERIVAESEQHGFWTLQSVIFPENEASLTVHARYGFRLVGKRERIAQLNGRWHDVLLLERRSAAAHPDGAM